MIYRKIGWLKFKCYLTLYTLTLQAMIFKVIPNAITPGISGQSSLACTLFLLVLLCMNFSSPCNFWWAFLVLHQKEYQVVK